VDSGTDVMGETRERELCRACGATQFLVGFEKKDRLSRAGERHGSGEPVGAGADNDGVVSDRGCGQIVLLQRPGPFQRLSYPR